MGMCLFIGFASFWWTCTYLVVLYIWSVNPPFHYDCMFCNDSTPPWRERYLHFFLPTQIQEKVDQILLTQDRLNTLWEERKQYNNQLHGLHVFLRDTNQLNRIASSQEVWNTFYFTSFTYNISVKYFFSIIWFFR